MAGADGAGTLVVEPVEAISFVMSQRMLRGVKERPERATITS